MQCCPLGKASRLHHGLVTPASQLSKTAPTLWLHTVLSPQCRQAKPAIPSPLKGSRYLVQQQCASIVARAGLRQQPSSADIPDPDHLAGSSQDGSTLWRLLSNAAKLTGALTLVALASLVAGPRTAQAAERAQRYTASTATVVSRADASAQTHSMPSTSYRYTGFDLAAVPSTSSSATLERPASTTSAPTASSSQPAASSGQDAVRAAFRSDEDYRAYLDRVRQQYLQDHPEHRDQPELVERMVLARSKGIPQSYDELMRSMVHSPDDVPTRNSREEVGEQIKAIMNQYEEEDFDLGIKQFMVESQVKNQQSSAGSSNRSGVRKGFEEALADALAEEEAEEPKEKARTDDMPSDAFTTEQAEEAVALFGDANSVKTAWRTQETLRELSYTQFWYLVGEGHVDKVRFYGPPERKAVLVTTKATAPGGVRTTKVVLPPDPTLFDHMAAHGVFVDKGVSEEDRLGRAYVVQLLRYTFPFMLISGVFWALHTWLLDPMPNVFRRREYVRYRRELMYVASKLNFRSPAREIKINTEGDDFIPWDDINGIDTVKAEIIEIIDYLKNPGLLRQRGVARIGGVLLAGAPGTGKTLLAKAIAAESGVRMFTCSGTDFFDVYSGVGARRIRETFDKLRNHAPAILFVDEFDALGAARGSAGGGEESSSIINELLVQLDGFEDNRGIVVLGATNRPGAIDSALIRPGRFDRIIYMPLPDAEGRAKILQVHARNKSVAPDVNWYEVARAMAGFTGADCMGLMQRAARMAARQGRERIEEEDIYAAMENKSLETFAELTQAPQAGRDHGVPTPIPHSLRKSIAVYEAGKALMAYITPDYQEVARVSVCPFDIITGYTLFVEDEEKSADAILTRSDLEGHMVVYMAGRSAEKLVMGESEVTGMGAPDLFHANMIAREMVLEMGMGRRMGPVDLMHLVPPKMDSGTMLRSTQAREEDEYYYHATEMSTEQSRVALAEVVELLEAAEAKAFYGISINWKPLQALVDALLDRGVLQGREVAHVLESNGVVHFPDPFIQGFGWEPTGELTYPFKPAKPAAEPEAQVEGEGAVAVMTKPKTELKGMAAKTWFAGTDKDVPREADGKLKSGWHWNMPYTVQKDLPEWFKKEVERYTY